MFKKIIKREINIGNKNIGGHSELGSINVRNLINFIRFIEFYNFYITVQLQWIPVKTRPLTDEEKNNYGENYTFMYDCLLPEDEQEVLITTDMGSVEQVTFYRHSEYGCYFEYYEDEGDVIAWMLLPEPYKEGSENSTIEKLEQEPKTGHWIRVDETKVKCSECEVIHLIAQYPIGEIKFCPNCGTKMVESEENKMTKEQLEYATKINHDINMLEEQFGIDKFIAENIAEKLGELQRQFESL